MSDRLKTLKSRKRWMSFLSFLLTVGPLIVFCLIGLCNGSVHVGNKLFLTMTVIVAIMLTIINLIKKYNLRSPIFLILLGLYVILDNCIPVLVTVSVGVIIDEFFISPYVTKLKQRILTRDEMENN